MMRHIFTILSLSVLVLSACTGGTSSVSETKEPIRIGFMGALTGDAASIGEASLGGALYAVQKINDHGGILGRPVELVVENDNCTAKEGVQAMTKLIKVSTVMAVSGPDCGSAAGGALPIAQEASTPVIIRWASVPRLTSIGDYIFRIFPSDNFQGAFAAEYIHDTLGKSKAAVLYVQNEYGEGLKDVFAREFPKVGGSIVFTDGFTQEEMDFRTLLAKAVATKPDVIYFPAYRIGGVEALKQIKELGIAIPIVAGDAFDSAEVIENPAAEGVLFPAAVTANPPEFQNAVRAATGKRADQATAPLGYDSVMIIAEAIKNAESADGVGIRDALVDMQFRGGISNNLIRFDAVGDLVGATYVMRIVRGGKSLPYQP